MSAFTAFAQKDTIVNSIGVNVRPSYIMATHGFYNGYNSLGRPIRVGGAAYLNYAFSYSPDSKIGQKYPGAYQGIGVGIQSFFAHEAIGTPYGVYLFQGAPILSINKRLALGYEWNLGLTGGWKPDEYLLTGSRLNIYINVGLLLNWNLNKNWQIQTGPEFTHYSNGDTTFPNGGANTINLRLGVRRCFGNTDSCIESPVIFDINTDISEFAERITYDFSVFGAWRADRMTIGNRFEIVNDTFLVAGLQFNPLYHLNQTLSFGPSLDIIYDRSANLIPLVDEQDNFSYLYPSFIKQCAAGLSLRGELRMPIFAINVGAGYNFSYRGSDLRGIYGSFILKAFVSKSMFVNIGYRLSSVLYSHNLMFGLGWRISHKNEEIAY